MSRASIVLLSLAALTLGQALQVKNGFLHPRAFVWLVVALGLVAAATRTARTRGLAGDHCGDVVPVILCAGALVQAAQLLWAKPLLYAPVRHGWRDPVLAVALSATALLVPLVGIGGRRARSLAFAAIVVAHVVAGARAIQLVPDPTIDVVTVQRAAIDAVSNLRSPHSISFTNIYGKASRFYAEGMATNSQVFFGFPYPPLALAFAAPAAWLLGDYRYALVASTAAAALLIASIGWTRRSLLSATVLLTMPRVLFLIEQGWTEPFAVVLLAATAALLARGPRGGPIVFGLTLAVKQYLAVALLLVPLLPRAAMVSPRRFVLRALATAAVVTVPFLIWDPYGFANSVVLLQLREPFRGDSLSVLAWLARHGLRPPGALAMLATLAAGIVAVAIAASGGGEEGEADRLQ